MGFCKNFLFCFISFQTTLSNNEQSPLAIRKSKVKIKTFILNILAKLGLLSKISILNLRCDNGKKFVLRFLF